MAKRIKFSEPKASIEHAPHDCIYYEVGDPWADDMTPTLWFEKLEKSAKRKGYKVVQMLACSTQYGFDPLTAPFHVVQNKELQPEAVWGVDIIVEHVPERTPLPEPTDEIAYAELRETVLRWGGPLNEGS